MRTKGKIVLSAGLAFVLIGAALFRALRLSALPKPIASAPLGDGRILQIEGDPFLVTIPPGANWFAPELVLLTPVEAEFTVKVPDRLAR